MVIKNSKYMNRFVFKNRPYDPNYAYSPYKVVTYYADSHLNYRSASLLLQCRYRKDSGKDFLP